MYSDEASLLRFLKGMHGMMKLTAVPVLNAFDLSRFKRVVDLGGATGALAAAAAGMCRQRTAIVMDLPHVVSVAQRHFAPALVEELERAACGHDNSSGVQTELNRLAFVGGDFFDTSSPLPPAELYMLGRILHNWDEGRIATLLARVHDALPPGAEGAACLHSG
jgi:acetylserotonin O-methyltransferase